MQSMKVSTRLAMLVCLSALLLVVVGGAGLWGLHTSNAAVHTVFADRVVPLRQLGEMQRLQLINQITVEAQAANPQQGSAAAAIKQVQENLAEIDNLWKAYIATQLTAEETRLTQVFVEARRRYRAEGLEPALEALRANDPERSRPATAQMRALYVDVRTPLEALLKLQSDEAALEDTASAQRFERLRNAGIATFLLGLAALVATGLAVTRGLLRELGAEPADAAALARRVAAGDLTQPVRLRAGDSSSMMASLAEMQQALRQAVSDVRRNADSVATASSEIAQGNLDLSQRTEEQASALQQTAASMEQLTGAVRQSADNARQASQLATAASDVAQRGGQAVGELVTTMQGLNESSRRIADIVGVIDGIAFQTNILALNAAVEAARAGDQGRGFAVVASEVRTLAQRSAAAAKDVKALIADSVTRIEAGGTVADRAGQTVGEVVDSIKRVSDLVAEISASSQEQSAGIDQVGQAVVQMDQVTQQNAALVEESTAAAESLRQQASQLLAAVQVFRLDEAQAPSAVQGSTAAAPARTGAERRGPQRAVNTVRPSFGRAAMAVAAAPRATGADGGWASF